MWVALAICVASLAAWDFGRRWVAREHDAVLIANAAMEEADHARVTAATADIQSAKVDGVISKHAIELSRLDKQIAAVAQQARNAGSPSVRQPRMSLTGSRK